MLSGAGASDRGEASGRLRLRRLWLRRRRLRLLQLAPGMGSEPLRRRQTQRLRRLRFVQLTDGLGRRPLRRLLQEEERRQRPLVPSVRARGAQQQQQQAADAQETQLEPASPPEDGREDAGRVGRDLRQQESVHSWKRSRGFNHRQTDCHQRHPETPGIRQKLYFASF